MSLKDLLQAAGGEQGRGALWRWMMAASELLDLVAPSGSSALSYGFAKRITTDQTITSGQNVAFNSGNTRGNISFVLASGSFILEAGKRYLLTAGGRLVNFTDTATGTLDLKFVDDNNNVINWPTGGAGSVLDCPAGTFTPATGTAAQSTGAVWQFPYEPGSSDASRTVKVRCTSATGSADVSSNRFWMSALEIG